MDIVTAFGIVLRQRRKEIAMSQEDLALSSELDRTYISLLERGKKSPTLVTIFKLAFVLDIKPSELLGRVEELKKNS